jgi:outer membrane protein
MQAILRRIGQTDGYTMIIEANEGGVVWVPANLDLTDVLIQRYNKQAKQGGGGGAKKSK